MTDNRIFRYADAMPKTDRDIGAIVAALRGQTPQRDLAEKMTQQGFRWTQGTVSSVEKGERSLKLTEGAALAEVLGTDVQSLVKDEDAARIEREYRAVEQALRDAHQELRSATSKLLAAQAYSRHIRSQSTEQEHEPADAEAQLDPVAVVADEQKRVEKELQESDQVMRSILAEYLPSPRRAGRRPRSKSLEGFSQPRYL
jgi:transcriptional regulator with XRE-family HTH domain